MRRSAGLLLVALLPGCAVSTSGAASSRRQCRPVDPGEFTWTPIAELLPTLPAALETAPLFARADTAVLYVYYGADSVPLIVQLEVTGEFDASDLRQAESALRESLRRQMPEGTRAHGLLVRGERLRLEPFELTSGCTPQLQNERDLQRLLAPLRRQPEFRDRSIVASLLVDSRGNVVEALIQQGSGSTAADLALLDVARRSRFMPARMNGIPVSARVTLPVGR